MDSQYGFFGGGVFWGNLEISLAMVACDDVIADVIVVAAVAVDTRRGNGRGSFYSVASASALTASTSI